MTKKKNTSVFVSQEDSTQAQDLFAQYHQIAAHLHASKDQSQAETALTEITTLSENAQVALLKALAKEHQVDAADVLTAINELSPLKSIRKEAKRSLLQLEGAKIYPQWEAPINRAPAITAIQPSTNPPRFWKGLMTDTRALGQVQLLLFWEEGDDYKDLRIIGLLLEFEHDGVKDFFTSIHKKRNFDKLLAEMIADAPDIELRDCSLAQGRRLLLDALAINRRRGTTPYKEYRFHLSLVQQLILDAPDIEEDAEIEKVERNINLHGLDPETVVTSFVEYWVDKEYDIAYDLLSKQSPLREGLTRDEWIERRESWADNAYPCDLEPDFIFEHKLQESSLWLPNPLLTSRPINHKKIEAAWSIELEETPTSDTLPELPQVSAIYEETGRHWFWASYTLIQEDGEWRIQNMTDETLMAQDLSVEELQSKMEQLDLASRDAAIRYQFKKTVQLKDQDTEELLAGMVRPILHYMYYADALLKQIPFDAARYEDVAVRMITLGQHERCLVYLTSLAQHVSEQQDLWLRRMASAQRALSEEFSEAGSDDHAERCLELAEQALRDSLAIKSSFEAHISLAEMLIEKAVFDEAEDHLLQAKELMTNVEEEAHVELHLGEIAMEQKQFQEALDHYQRVVDLQPNASYAWFDVGKAHQELQHFDEAETSYQRAIELEPDRAKYYHELRTLYSENDQPAKAMKTLKQGMAANPDSPDMLLYMVGYYMELGEFHQAEILLDKAEELVTDSFTISAFRLVLDANKSMQSRTTPRLPKQARHKKKR